jgi:NAD(P)-dependent dehydrogenase (short-subunit alcohol dehydrogenase family)
MTMDDRKSAVVTGGAGGLGRGVVAALAAKKLKVLAIGRDPAKLAALRETGAEVMAADAADEMTSGLVLQDRRPDLVVLCAGATPLLKPIHQHSWRSFSANWEVDAKSTFVWVRDALSLPLKPGSHVVVISSGAALQGSPLSGGYAPAKRAQMFVAEYAAQEVKRQGLGIRIHYLAPRLNASSEMGRAAIAAYAGRAGVQPEEFVKRFGPPLTPQILGQAVVDLWEKPEAWPEVGYQIGGAGILPLTG